MMIDEINSILLEKILETYTLPIFGIHGIRHWARVYENGMELSKITTASIKIVGLFAVLHDSKRINESVDPGHGERAAEFMKTLCGDFIELCEDEYALLYHACANHTKEKTHPDVTIQTCYDADRLDLARAGIRVNPHRLCTTAAKNPEMITWANERSLSDYCPGFVHDEWLNSV